MTAMEEEVDDRFAGIDIDSLLSRTDHRPLSYGRKKALYEAPEFIQRLNGEETVMEGQSLCIECKVRGFPVPTLRWFKDDEEILDHPRIHVESTGTGGYSLIIDKVNKGDEAAYRCRAENLEGACSSFFFLSVKAKPKSQKKKDQKSSPNRRTVSFPPMFATIVEKVEEEEKQGEELQKLPPSPMTDFYYALTLKGRQSWPAFVGDWAFVNGGHSHNRRSSTGSITTESCECSSDDEVFDEQNSDIHIDEDDDGRDERLPAKKPIFYLAGFPDADESEASPTRTIIVFNSNLSTSSRGQGETAIVADILNERNNNIVTCSQKEVLDNEEHVEKELDKTKLDNIPAASKNEVDGSCKNVAKLEEPEMMNENVEDKKDNEAESLECVKLSSLAAKETKSHVDARHETKIKPNKYVGDTRLLVTGNETSCITAPSNRQMADDENKREINKSSATGLSPVPDAKGRTTPPIFVELWEENEASECREEHTSHSQNRQQAPLLSTGNENNNTWTTSGYSREEREPTPYFPGGDIPNRHNQHSFLLGARSSCSTAASDDYSRTEREPTPYFDEKSTLQNVSPASSTSLQRPSKFLILDAAQEFHREPTPFFESRNKTKLGATALSADMSDVADAGVRAQRELTPFYSDSTSKSISLPKEKSNLLAAPTSLSVSPLSGNTRDARESTPYYREKDPYDYIHHPDHHFSEKKSALVKQKSNDEEFAPREQQSSLSSVQPLSRDKHQASKPSSQQSQPPSLTLGIPVNTTADKKSQQPTQSGLRAIEQRHPADSRSRSPDLASQRQITVELKHGASLSTLSTTSSPVLVCTQQPKSETHSTTASDDSKSRNKNKPLHIKAQVFSRTDEAGKQETKKLSSQILDKPTPASSVSYSGGNSSPASRNLQTNVPCESGIDNVDAVKRFTTPLQAPAKPSVLVPQPAQTSMEKSAVTPRLRPSTPNKTLAGQLPQHSSLAPGTSSQLQSEPSKLTQSASSEASERSKPVIGASQVQNGNQQLGKRLPVQTGHHKQVTIISTEQSKTTPSSDHQAVPRHSVQVKRRSQPDLDSVLPATKGHDVPTNKNAPLAEIESLEAQPEPSPTFKPERTGHVLKIPQNSKSLPSSHAAAKYTASGPPHRTPPYSTKTQETENIVQRNVQPRQLMVSAKNIYPVEICEDESPGQVTGTPPAATALKKRSLASGVSSALSTFFKPKRNPDDQKENTETEEKVKRNIFSKVGRKKKSRTTHQATTEAASSEEVQPQQVREVLVTSQTLAKCSPFGAYTLEGFCCLFVLTVFCLHIEMPIEKFMCYVLAAFYTFCVMRILGVIT